MYISFIGAAENSFLAAARSPGMIVGPVANLLGMLYDMLFNFIYSFIQSGSLGIAIILFTIVVKLVLFPLGYKQQKSTYKMQKLQPELDKIKAKYAGKKDQESQQRMAFEMQDFQKSNGISLFGGCLPLLLQLPILYALFYIFQQAYLYVGVIEENYIQITNAVLAVPVELRVDVFGPVAMAKNYAMDLAVSEDVIGLVNIIRANEWSAIIGALGEYGKVFSPLLEHKAMVEGFVGLSLVENPGIGFPGILIPLAAGFSTWISTKVLTASQSVNQNDPSMGMMKTMNTIMPIMMGVMTINMPAGLGLYWTISNIFQMAQSWGLTKYFKSKESKEVTA